MAGHSAGDRCRSADVVVKLANQGCAGQAEMQAMRVSQAEFLIEKPLNKCLCSFKLGFVKSSNTDGQCLCEV